MSFTLSQIAVQRVIQLGLAKIKADKTILEDIFADYANYGYPTDIIDQIWDWLSSHDIPVVQAWNFNKTRVPGVSIHLAQEMEDETKAAMDDYFYEEDEIGTVGISQFTVNLDIGIHANKTGDEVLWLYYLVNYCLFMQKRTMESYGIMLHSFSGSDYGKEMEKLPDNVWSRWIRFRGTATNSWTSAAAVSFDSIIMSMTVEDSLGTSVPVTSPTRTT